MTYQQLLIAAGATSLIALAALGITVALWTRLNAVERRYSALVDWAWSVEDDRNPPDDTQPMGDVLAEEVQRPTPYKRVGRHAQR